jgi:hypothetical protein
MKAILGGLVLGIALFAIAAFAQYLMNVHNAYGSVAISGEYNSKVVTTAAGTSTLTVKPGALGSVVVTVPAASPSSGPLIAFYDTSSTTRATTTMSAFVSLGTNGGTAVPAGTYTFDATASSGILMWVNPSISGSLVVTYR